jgi:hypothetical protein
MVRLLNRPLPNCPEMKTSSFFLAYVPLLKERFQRRFPFFFFFFFSGVLLSQNG